MSYPNQINDNLQDSSIAYLIRLIKKWKKAITWITGLTAVASTIIAFLVLPVYYKASATFYVLNSSAYDPRTDENNYALYGDDEDADRAMTVGASAEIRNYICNKYKLADKYEIDTNATNGKFKLKKKYESNFELRENEKSAIELTFFDYSADTAAMIVNDILSKINEIQLKPVRESSEGILKAQIQLAEEFATKSDSLAATFENGKQSNQAKLAGEFVAIERFNTISEARELQRNLELINKAPSTLFVIEKASPDHKKAKPQRLLIVALATIAALILSVLLAAIIDHIEELKSKNLI